MPKIQYPKTDAEKAKLYLHCMMEIKLRIAAVNAILDSSALDLFKHETSYLHLRHICEIVSIACLAAQGDYETQRAFTEEYSPPKIFKALRQLYPHFFPEPCTLTSMPLRDGSHHHHLDASPKEGAYVEKDITDLWNTAGNHLHRASVRRYLSNSLDRPPPDLTPITAHLNGLSRLLDDHIILVRNAGPQKVLLHVSLNVDEGGVGATFLHVDDVAATISVDSYRSTLVVRPSSDQQSH